MPEKNKPARKRRTRKIQFHVYYGRGGGYQECTSPSAVADFVRYYLRNNGPTTFAVEGVK